MIHLESIWYIIHIFYIIDWVNSELSKANNRAKDCFFSESMMHFSHFLYRFLEGKKTTRTQFCIPGLREIHRNLKQEKKISQVLFQKIPLLYFFLHKSWIWRTLGQVMNIFSYCHFIMLQKNAIGQKKNFEYHARVQKCNFGKNEKLTK